MAAMQGELVKYGPSTSHLAFITPGDAPHDGCPRHFVLVGGLTDGLLFSSFVPPLGKALALQGWSLVQAQLSSSYAGWGWGCLDQDAEEIMQLAAWLLANRSSAGMVVMGHSTGCQDAVRFAQRLHQACDRDASVPSAPAGAVWKLHAPAVLPVLKGIILQAPVSDREWLSMHAAELHDTVVRARDMVARGDGAAIVGRLALLNGAPVSAARLLSLHDVGGDDDMFSTDLSDAQLQAMLGPVTACCPCLVLASGADEAVPDPAGIPAQAGRLVQAMSRLGCPHDAHCVVLQGAPHSASGHEAALVEAVMGFLAAL